jgi:hypothetical protein
MLFRLPLFVAVQVSTISNLCRPHKQVRLPWQGLGLSPRANTGALENRRTCTWISRAIRRARSFTRQAIRSALQPLDRNLAVVVMKRVNGHPGFAFYPARMSASVPGPFSAVGVSLATPGLLGVPGFVNLPENSRTWKTERAGHRQNRNIMWLVARRGGLLVALGNRNCSRSGKSGQGDALWRSGA